MLLAIMTCMLMLTSQAYSQELPQFTVVEDVLEKSEMRQLQQLTEDLQPEFLWYGRYNFWREDFEAVVNDAGSLVFTHVNKNPSDAVTDTLSAFFISKVEEFGADIRPKRIHLESYLDRNLVQSENALSSGMFWHRDSIVVNGEKKIADFTMILLVNGEVQDWEGADIVLQLGGQYREAGSYDWINSDYPTVQIKPRYNQAIIFKNSDAGHMVTPLIPLTNSVVHRDVFIITCYLQDNT